MPRSQVAIGIGGRRIADDMPPFVIAEIGINHGGSLDRGLRLIDAAASAGAHAVKFQTIIARDLVSSACPPPAHVAAGSLVEFFERFELDEAGHVALAERARTFGLKVISTPFSEAAVELLERVGIDAYKIASGDLTWDQLIVRCALTGKPLIMSTGMATLAEAQHAVAVARMAGASGVALLHCVSSYPVPHGSENLLAIRTLAEGCDVPVGLSDHGDDGFAAPMAVALGASVYERHIVLDGDDDAVDRAVSSAPADFESTAQAIRRAWLALGSGRKACLAAEAQNVVASRRSWCAARPLAAGTAIAPGDLIALRPATGVPPGSSASIVGKRLARSVAQGEPLTYSCFEFSLAESGRVA
jgi:N,N'-diacetyllegionaminate synthase